MKLPALKLPTIRPVSSTLLSWLLGTATVLAVLVVMAVDAAMQRPAEHTSGYHLDPVELADHEPLVAEDGVRVLCYHYFRRTVDVGYFLRVLGAVILGAPTLGPHEFWTTPIEQFERHLRWITDQKIPVLTLDEVAAYQRRGEPVPDRAVVITIDDADRSVHDLAWPLLQRYGLRAHLFVPTGRVGQSWSGIEVCTWPQLNVMAASGTMVLGSHSHDLHYKVMTDRGRQPVFWSPDAISTVQTASTRSALLELIAADGRSDSNHRQLVDPILTDLRLSRRLLEHHTQTPCRWLAWPYGFGHNDLDRQAEAAGFAGTLSLRARTVDSESAPWHVGRFTLTAKTTLQDIAMLLADDEGN